MASSQEWCVTNCDQENRTSKTVKQALCYKSIQWWQAGLGSGCRDFALSTGKKVRKDEQLSSRGFRALFLPLAEHSAVRGAGGGRDAWSVRLTLGTRVGRRACRALPVLSKDNIHGLLCQILGGMWQTSARSAGLHPGLVFLAAPWHMAELQAPRACAFEQNWIQVCLIERDKVLLLHHWPLSQFKALLYCSQLFTDTLYEDKDPCLVFREI